MGVLPLHVALALALVACVTIAPAARARADRSGTLSFEATGDSLNDWDGQPSGPAGTLFLDRRVVHGGRASGRIERGPASPNTFSSMAAVIPVDFTGDQIHLRGWLKRENVKGFAGLWMRVDSRSRMLQFDNMESRHLDGTADWEEFHVVLSLDKSAKEVTVGGILAGRGTVWIDDLEVLVDGKPLNDVPVQEQPKTVLDTDHEFDKGSGITTTTLTKAQIENLVTLAKVWGFLKYHHPRVTAGEFHWDYELFRIMPEVLATHDRVAAAQAMNRWVRGLGTIPGCKPCAQNPAGRPMVPRIGWIRDLGYHRLGGGLSSQLERIRANRPAGSEQFYVTFAPGVGNPDFGNELSYNSDQVPDPGYRLLALFRLWNIVEYWFPYRDVMEEDWEGVLREFVPRLAAASTRDSYRLELIALIARMHDTHANLWGSLDVRPPRGAGQLPLQFRFLGDRLVVAGYTDSTRGPASGLEPGDVVRAIDGMRPDSLLASWRPLYAASNEASRRRDVALQIGRGDSLRSAILTIERAGRVSDVTVARIPSYRLKPHLAHDHPGETFRRVSPDLAYLTLSSVKPGATDDYIRAAAGARCLIIDIRNYPSEFVVFALGGHLVDKDTPFAIFTTADASNPGSFVWSPGPVSIAPLMPRFEGRIAILVDETSQSQAEYTTMAFRSAPGAIVVGSTTAGADGNVSPIPLPGGVRGLMSGIGVFYPDHRPTQRIGIVPDVEARPTVAGITAGRDEVLEAAVRHVLKRDITDAERRALDPDR